MFDTIYLVTVFHHKNKKLVQHLLGGTFEKAIQLRNFICSEVFHNKLDYLTSSITEITNGKIKCHIGADEDFVEFDRKLDNDFFLYHVYESYDAKTGAYSMQIGFSNEKGTSNRAALSVIQTDRELMRHDYVTNKINFRGVTALDKNGSETKVEFIKTSRYGGEEVMSVEDDVKIARIR